MMSCAVCVCVCVCVKRSVVGGKQKPYISKTLKVLYVLKYQKYKYKLYVYLLNTSG